MQKGFNMPPVDGNAIVAANRKRQAQPGSYGMIRNSQTGQGIEVFGDKGIDANQSAFAPQPQPDFGIPADIGKPNFANAIYDQEEYEGGRDMVTDQALASNSGGSGQSTSMGQEPMSQDDLYEAQKEYMTNSGKLKGYLDKTGMSMDELLQDLDPEVTNDDVKLFMNSENITNADESMRAGMAADAIFDAGGFDAEKFYTTGELEQCGSECQERRQMNKAQAAEYEDAAIKRNEQPMEMSDKEFQKRYAMIGE